MEFVLNLQKLVAFNDGGDAVSTITNSCSTESINCGGGGQSNLSVTLCQ